MKLTTPQRRLLGYLLFACLLTQGYDLWAIHAATVDGGAGGTTLGVGGGLLIAGGVVLLTGLVMLIASDSQDETTADGCWNAGLYLIMGTMLLTVGGVLAIVGLVLFLVERDNQTGVTAGKGLRGRARRAQLRAYAFLAKKNPKAAERLLRRRMAKAERMASRAEVAG